MSESFVISDQQPSDQPAIDHLLDLSFGLDRRVKTSYRLREGSAPVEGLSMVVRDKALGIIGTISFWPLAIGTAATPALLLGPLAVHPQCKNKGIGLALMKEGLKRAKALCHRLVILVGDQPYYARVGFDTLPSGLLTMPGPVDPKRFLYLELVPGSLKSASGLVLPPHRVKASLAPLAVPHGAHREEERCEA